MQIIKVVFVKKITMQVLLKKVKKFTTNIRVMCKQKYLIYKWVIFLHFTNKRLHFEFNRLT